MVNSFRSLSGWLRQMRVAILPRHSDVSCQSCCYTGYQPRCHGKSCIAQPAEWTIARKRGLTVQIIVKSERRAGRQDPRRNNVEFVRCSNLPAGTAQHGAVRRSHTPNPKFPRYSRQRKHCAEATPTSTAPIQAKVRPSATPAVDPDT